MVTGPKCASVGPQVTKRNGDELKVRGKAEKATKKELWGWGAGITQRGGVPRE